MLKTVFRHMRSSLSIAITLDTLMLLSDLLSNMLIRALLIVLLYTMCYCLRLSEGNITPYGLAPTET